MAALAELHNRILVAAPAAPEFMVVEAVRDAVQEFLSYTHAWNATLAVEADADDPEMVLPVPRGAEVIHVRSITLGGHTLRPINAREFSDTTARAGGTGQPVVYQYLGGATVDLYPAPMVSMEGSASVAFKLSRTGDTLPDEVFDLWRTAFVDGALANVLAAATGWGNMSVAKYHADRWQGSLRQARARAFRDKSNTTYTVGYGGY